MRKLLIASGLLLLAWGAAFAQLSQGSCDADADCFHTGCSGQVCASVAVVTTCEFRCEYGCYAAASCECFGNRCGFRHGSALQSCLRGCRGDGISPVAGLDFTPDPDAPAFGPPASPSPAGAPCGSEGRPETAQKR